MARLGNATFSAPIDADAARMQRRRAYADITQQKMAMSGREGRYYNSRAAGRAGHFCPSTVNDSLRQRRRLLAVISARKHYVKHQRLISARRILPG